jgi:hypothetical protein
MPGVQISQTQQVIAGAVQAVVVTTINAAGQDSYATAQPGIVTGLLSALALVGAAHARYEWSAVNPGGILADLRNPTSATPAVAFPQGGYFLIECVGKSVSGSIEAAYTLPLMVVQSAETASAQNVAVVAADSPYTVPASATRIECDTTAGPIELVVGQSAVSRRLTVVDAAGKADQNAITITFTPDTLRGGTGYVVGVPYAIVDFTRGLNEWQTDSTMRSA